jgi:hypothetical protein
MFPFFFNKTGTLTQPAILSLLPCRCCFSSFLAAAAACSSPFLSSRPSAVPSKPRYEQGRPALEIHYRCCCFVSSSPLLRRTGEGSGGTHEEEASKYVSSRDFIQWRAGRLFSSLVPFVASLIPVVAQSGDLLLSECPRAVSLPAEILRTKMRLLAAL